MKIDAEQVHRRLQALKKEIFEKLSDIEKRLTALEEKQKKRKPRKKKDEKEEEEES